MNNDTPVDAIQVNCPMLRAIKYADDYNRLNAKEGAHMLAKDFITDEEFRAAAFAKHRTTSLAAHDGLVDKAELREAIETAIFSRAVDIIGRLPSEAAKFPSVLEQYAEVATEAALASIEAKQ